VVLGELLSLIRFPTMSMEEIASQVAPSGFLSENQLLDIFKFKAMSDFSKDDSKFDFPTKPREGTGLCRDSRIITKKHKKDIIGLFGKQKNKIKFIISGQSRRFQWNDLSPKMQRTR